MSKKASKDYEELLARVTSSKNMDLPLTITQKQAQAILHVVHDVGGEPDGPLDKSEHKTAFWEKSTHCVAECLAWRGHWNAEERRRRENDLGETIYFGTPYYARWLLATAKMLIEKGYITPDELIEKMDEIRRREGYVK
ncbi:SH3-like domain-containing protein [Legionella waltersii]|uniref:Thiocyanate hydrolase subunit beta n=1 Tax=Legionella waltersii TaxID=66969 RepID=A0A0W1A1Z5_9GAMM|nr:SH3-like domain-containing protein [Legionella waltersii]KTD75302.1 Thiocyanate hydrolase subunit beta [Legionella waltersii]SNV07025.1 Thiocyanate hydrolase [Legionella waltersii]